MHAPLTPEQERIDALIDRAAHLALWLAGQLRDWLAPGKSLGVPVLRHILRHYLQPAEAAVRRAVHLMASELPAAPRPVPRLKTLPRVIPPLQPAKRETVRPPAFRLSEPQPRPQTDHGPESRRPRITVLTPGAPSPSSPSPRRPRLSLEDRVRRRFAALDAVLAEPVRAAHRLRRLQARQPARRPLLSLTKIPGYRAGPITDIGRAALDAINAELLARATPTADTS